MLLVEPDRVEYYKYVFKSQDFIKVKLLLLEILTFHHWNYVEP